MFFFCPDVLVKPTTLFFRVLDLVQTDADFVGGGRGGKENIEEIFPSYILPSFVFHLIISVCTLIHPKHRGRFPTKCRFKQSKLYSVKKNDNNFLWENLCCVIFYRVWIFFFPPTQCGCTCIHYPFRRVQLKCDGTRWRTEGKWKGNWRMEWVASTLHTTSEHGISSITTADAHTSAASTRLKWRPRRFKWTRPFRRKRKSGFCAYAITFQTQSTTKRLLILDTTHGNKGHRGRVTTAHDAPHCQPTVVFPSTAFQQAQSTCR